MRDLTPEEQKLWMAVTKSITPVGEPRRPGIDVPYQILNPIPSKVLDLHGLKVYDAFLTLKSFLEDAYLSSVRRVTVITGKSGVIRKEFPDWVDRFPVHRHELLIGGGAFRVYLAKKPQKTDVSTK